MKPLVPLSRPTNVPPTPLKYSPSAIFQESSLADNKQGEKSGMQRNTSIESVIRGLEKQISKGSSKSRLSTSRRRPGSTYRDMSTASYLKGNGNGIGIGNGNGNSKLSTTNSHLGKSTQHSTTALRTNASKHVPL